VKSCRGSCVSVRTCVFPAQDERLKRESRRPAWGLLVRGSSLLWHTAGVSWAILPPQVSTADTVRMLSTLRGDMRCQAAYIHRTMQCTVRYKAPGSAPAGFCCMISRASALLPVLQSTRYARGALNVSWPSRPIAARAPGTATAAARLRLPLRRIRVSTGHAATRPHAR